MSLAPVFLVGLDRSGKTPLRGALERHTSVAIVRGADLWTWVSERFGDLADDGALGRCMAALETRSGLPQLGVDLAAVREQFASGPRTYARLFALIGAVYAMGRGKRRWGLQEAGAESRADAILAAHPDARIVHLVRDPRSRLAAVAADGGARRSGVGGETARWVRSVRLADMNRRRFPDSYLVLRYEDLVDRHDEALASLCTFVGERLSNGMVADIERLSREPASSSLRASDAAFIEWRARDEMAAYGYEAATPRLSVRDSLRYVLLDRPLNMATMVAWAVRERFRKDRAAAATASPRGGRG